MENLSVACFKYNNVINYTEYFNNKKEQIRVIKKSIVKF